MYLWDDGIIDQLIHGLYSMMCSDVLQKIDIMQSADIAVIFIWLYVENTFILHHDDVIKWKHFQRNWPLVRGIHRSPVNSPHKGQWRGALIISLICVWINGWVNNRGGGDLRRFLAHYDVIVMIYSSFDCLHHHSVEKWEEM